MIIFIICFLAIKTGLKIDSNPDCSNVIGIFFYLLTTFLVALIFLSAYKTVKTSNKTSSTTPTPSSTKQITWLMR